MEIMETLFTKDDYARLPEEFPAQLIEGQLVREAAPIYDHQQVAGRIYRLLCGIHDPEQVLFSPVDVPIDEHNVYQPDVAVYREPLPLGVGGTRVPILVFEVLSPSTASLDRDTKRRRYLAAGVEEVWLIDVQAQAIEISSADGSRVVRGADVARSACMAGLALVPSELLKLE